MASRMFVNVAAGGEIHDGIGAVVYRGVQLLQFFVDFRGDRRVADVGVDLAQRGHTDGHRLEFGMVDVRGNNHAAAGYFVAHEFGGDLLFVCDKRHFLGDYALAGVVHLRKIAVLTVPRARGQPLCAGLWDGVSVAGVAVSRRHIRPAFMGIV